MKYSVFIIFFLVLGIYLYFEWNEKKKSTGRMKLFLMPALLTALLIYAYLKGWSVPITLCAALVLGFLGDYFLIGEIEKNRFIMGIGAFLLGHVLYAWMIYQKIENFQILHLIRLFLFYFLVLIVFIRFLDDKKGFFGFYLLYGLIIVSMAIASVMLLTEQPDRISFLILLGAHLFMISDMGILWDFKYPKRWSPVILLYSLGQFFLALGILLKYNN